MTAKLLVHAIVSFFILLLAQGVKTDYSIDSKFLAYFFANFSFFMAIAFQSVNRKKTVLRVAFSILIYVLAWWVAIISLMYFCDVLEGYDVINVYLRNAVSDSRFYFFKMLVLFLLGLTFMELFRNSGALKKIMR